MRPNIWATKRSAWKPGWYLFPASFAKLEKMEILQEGDVIPYFPKKIRQKQWKIEMEYENIYRFFPIEIQYSGRQNSRLGNADRAGRSPLRKAAFFFIMFRLSKWKSPPTMILRSKLKNNLICGQTDRSDHTTGQCSPTNIILSRIPLPHVIRISPPPHITVEKGGYKWSGLGPWAVDSF